MGRHAEKLLWKETTISNIREGKNPFSKHRISGPADERALYRKLLLLDDVLVRAYLITSAAFRNFWYVLIGQVCGMAMSCFAPETVHATCL